jgi:hypothetical protein
LPNLGFVRAPAAAPRYNPLKPMKRMIGDTMRENVYVTTRSMAIFSNTLRKI